MLLDAQTSVRRFVIHLLEGHCASGMIEPGEGRVRRAVAVVDEDYRRQHDGCADLEATVATLRKAAERVAKLARAAEARESTRRANSAAKPAGR